jgi:uncharacterized membrane protein
MTTLLVLGFPYPTSANAAAEDILLQEPELAGEPDAVAVVTRDEGRGLQITTNHTLGTRGRRFFWHLLITALVLLPESQTHAAAGLRDHSQRLAALGLDALFQDRLRTMLAPGTSALFLLVTKPVPAGTLTSLGRFGGRLLAASLVADVEAGLMHALHAIDGVLVQPAEHPAEE